MFALVEPTDLGAANNSSSSIECQSGTWATSDAIEQETWPTSDAIEQEIILPALHGELLFVHHTSIQFVNMLETVVDIYTIF